MRRLQTRILPCLGAAILLHGGLVLGLSQPWVGGGAGAPSMKTPPRALAAMQVRVRTQEVRPPLALDAPDPASTQATDQPDEPAPQQAAGAASSNALAVMDEWWPKSALSTPPQPLHSIAVPYPEGVSSIGPLQAHLIITLFIDEQGYVRRVEPQREPPPDPALLLAASEAFLQARFSPGLLREQAVKSKLTIEVNFDNNVASEAGSHGAPRL